MSQMPRWYRKQVLENKLREVLYNPLSDVSDVQAAKKAINKKLDQQDRDYEYYQITKVNKYLDKL